MGTSVKADRSTTPKAQPSVSAPRRQPAAHPSLKPGLGNSPAQHLRSLVAKSRRNERMEEATLWLAGETKKRKLMEEQKQFQRRRVRDEALIKRFGPEVNLSIEDFRKFDEGRATDEEAKIILEKYSLLPELVKKFYRTMDVANMKDIDAKDLDVLISMLSTEFSVIQNNTKHITKVLKNSAMAANFSDAMEGKSVFLGGFVGASEATENLSPEQQVTSLGLDYEYQQKTDFLLQTGTDSQGKPSYVPIPQTCYMKIPYTKELKKLTMMTLDVRFYEKILERANQAKDGAAALSFDQKTIAEMAKEICESKVSLKYKIAGDKASESEAAEITRLSELHKNQKPVKAAAAPFTGLGFSAYGVRMDSGFMNMYPEMNISVNLDQENTKKYLGEGNSIEFYTKFSRTSKQASIDKPDGSTDILMGKWDGKEMTIPALAQRDYSRNLEMMKSKFPKDDMSIKSLEANQFSLPDIKEKLAAKKKLLALMSGEVGVLKTNGQRAGILEKMRTKLSKVPTGLGF